MRTALSILAVPFKLVALIGIAIGAVVCMCLADETPAAHHEHTWL